MVMRLKLCYWGLWLLTRYLLSHMLVKAEDPWPEADRLLHNSTKMSKPITSDSKDFPYNYGTREINLYIPMDYSLEREKLEYNEYWKLGAKEWHRKVYQLLSESSNQYHNPQATRVLANMHLWSDYGIPHNKSLSYEYLNKYNELTNFSDAEALFELGAMHCTGLFGTIPVDPVKGLLYYQKSASLGDTRAKQALAYRYYSGINVPRDCDRALLLYRETADQVRHSHTDDEWDILFPNVESYGVRIPDFSGGLLGRELSSVIPSTRRMASPRPDITSSFLTKINDGTFVLQVSLGNGGDNLFSTGMDEDNEDKLVDIYYTAFDDYRGTYTKGRNCEKARELLEFAYEAYDHNVQTMDIWPKFFYGMCLDLLGHIYFTGEGLEAANVELAEKFLERSTRILEHSQLWKPWDSSRNTVDLGLIKQYYYKNDTAAIEFYEKFMEDHGLPGILNFQLAKLATKYPEQDLGDPFVLMQIACVKRYVPAIYEFARMTEKGMNNRYNCEDTAFLYKKFIEEDETYVAPHLKRAYTELISGNSEVALWAYTLAAEQGFETAHVSAAYLLYQLPYNFEEPPRTSNARKFMAVSYYTRAFKLGNADAGVVAGNIYYSMGDYANAFNMYQSASVKSSPQALWNLGYMYEHGLGVETDFHLAKRYYEQILEHHSDLRMAIKLSVWKLQLKSLFLWITTGKTNELHNGGMQTESRPQPWYQKLIRSFKKVERETAGEQNSDFQQQQHQQQEQRQQQEHDQARAPSLWDLFQSPGLRMEDLVSIAFVLLLFLISLIFRIVATRRGWNMNNMQFQVNALGGNFEFQIFAI